MLTNLVTDELAELASSVFESVDALKKYLGLGSGWALEVDSRQLIAWSEDERVLQLGRQVVYRAKTVKGLKAVNE